MDGKGNGENVLHLNDGHLRLGLEPCVSVYKKH